MQKISSFLQEKWKGVLILLGGCLVHLVLGSFYLWGNINVYVTSYYRLHSDGSLTITVSSALFCLMLLGISIGFFFTIPLATKVGFRLAALIETFFIAVCVFVSSYMSNFWLFVLFFGIFFGVLNGLLYMIPVYLACQYFPNSKGIISGIITGFFGLATIFSSLIAQEIVNPDNLKATIKEGSDKYFTADVADNLMKFIKYLSLYYLILGVVGALLFFDPPQNQSLKTELEDEERKPKKANESINDPLMLYGEGSEFTAKTALKSFKVYHIFLMNFFSSGLGLLIASHFKDYGMTKINDDQFLTMVGSVGAVCNGCGRMVWGLLYDRLTFRRTYFICLVIQIVFIATYELTSDMKPTFFIWTCVLLFCEGAHFALFPALCLTEFGTEIGSKLYPVVYFAFTCSNFLQFGIIYFLKSEIGFSNIFWIFLGLTAVSFALAIIFKENAKGGKMGSKKK